MKLVIIFIISLFLATSCNEKVLDDNTEEHIKVIKNNVKVYEDEVYTEDLISIEDKDIHLITNNREIDTYKLGKKNYEIIYSKDNKKYSYKLVVEIVDDEAPRIIGGVNKTVNIGYNGNPCELLMYGDNYDKEAKCVVEGSYNTSVEGVYNIKYILTDTSNNKKEANATLTVKKSSGSSSGGSSSAPKLYFSDVVSKYKNENTEIGIDVSKWQGDIDFEKVKNAGATFVMMRIGVQKNVKGNLELDKYYKQNMENAKKAGLKVGVYLYSIATSEKEAKSHAKWVVNKLDGEQLDLPVVFDWENWSKWNTYKLSFHDINAIANRFIITVRDAGYSGMLYSSKYYLENIWENNEGFPVWLAHYTDNTNYQGKYMMWQLSNTGRIDGIYGDVDIDILYKK